MPNEEIEIVITRQWASHLKTPVFLVDPQGNLLYYNEPAEPLVGRRFSEADEMSAKVWSTAFEITDDDGVLLKPEELPLTIALTEHRPAHRRFWAVGLDNVRRHIETTCFPLEGEGDRFLGAVAFFWALED